MKIKSLFLLFFVLATNLRAQNLTTAQSLDFWVGTWDAYWNDSLKGTNVITKNLKNMVIEENFSINDQSFFGQSWSVFDAQQQRWNQTWVDDAGTYMLFSGGVQGDSVILIMDNPPVKNGKTTHMRMVFYQIQKQGFNWDWQQSTDGKIWETVWAVIYKRR